MPPLNLYARVRVFVHVCTRDRGCSAHPVFPAPSDQEGKAISSKARAHQAARSRRRVCRCVKFESLPSSSANGSRECAPDDRLRRTIQYSRDVSDGIDRPRRTGCPAFAGHDGGGGARWLVARRRKRRGAPSPGTARYPAAHQLFRARYAESGFVPVQFWVQHPTQGRGPSPIGETRWQTSRSTAKHSMSM